MDIIRGKTNIIWCCFIYNFAKYYDCIHKGSYLILKFMYKRSFLVNIILALIFIGCNNKENEKVKNNKPIRIKVQQASTMSMDNAKKYVGIVEECEATAVSFTSLGVVKKTYVQEGQFVNKGQLIAEMDISTSENTLEVTQVSTNQANDMVEQAQATFDQAKDAYDRMKVMYEAGALPEIKWIEVETKLKQAETALNTAKSGVQSAQATQRIAKKNLEDNKLYAPVSGIIGSKMIQTGETALPSQAVVNILNIDQVKVKIPVPEMEMREIHTNSISFVDVMAAGVNTNGGDIEKGVQADPLTHTYDVRINVKNPTHQILPGMVANVNFANTNQTGLIMLPITAVQKKADNSLFVWTVTENNTAHRTPVTIGNTCGNLVEICSGIQQGQKVIVEGYQKVGENSKVIF